MNEKRPRKSFEAETKALCKLLDKKRIRKAQKNQKSKENYKNLLKKTQKKAKQHYSLSLVMQNQSNGKWT